MLPTDRIKDILLQPQSEWQAIEIERTTRADLCRRYVAPLAAIGPVASFIGFSLIGVGIPLAGQYRMPLGIGLTSALVAFLMSLAGVFLIALIINALAPAFSGRKDAMQAFKLAVYASTPAWLGGVFQLLPALAVLAIAASLYALYLLYLGLPVLMKAPQEKALGYTVVVVVCAIVIYAVIGAATASVGRLGVTPRIAGSAAVSDDASAALGELGAAVDAAARKMEQAQQSGDISAQVAAGSEMMNALVGGAQFDPVDHLQLKAMIPEALGSFKRIRLGSETDTTMGTKIAHASAAFGDEGHYREIRLSITDTAGSRGVAMLAAWATEEQESETESGYAKTGKVGNRVIHEEYDRSAQQGSYSVLIAKRFMVEARGHGIEVDALHQAVAKIDLDKLEALKNHGARQ